MGLVAITDVQLGVVGLVLSAAAIGAAWAISRTSGLRRPRLVAVLAAIVILAPIPVLATQLSPPLPTPRVLAIVATGYDVSVEPVQVGRGYYTVQVHNTSAEAGRVTVAKNGHTLFTLVVPAGGWRFRALPIATPAAYAVAASAPGAPVQRAAFTAR